MEVSVAEIQNFSEDLIADRKSREIVAGNARQLRMAEDGGVLKYVPPSDESKIWEAILFLEGVDLKDSPATYIHNSMDLEDFRKKLSES